MAALTRYSVDGVTLLGDLDRPGGVTFAFTERTGGASEGVWSSLNLGDACGDDAACVAENRRRVLAALSASADPALLVNPKQVHGDTVVRITEGDAASVAAARAAARAGADAIAVSVPGVSVLLCFADCVPVVICAPGGFAVAHSGWKGTIARIAAKAARELSAITGATTDSMRAYIGPHILGAEYEVSPELAERFAAEFGPCALAGERNLDLGACIEAALVDAGLDAANICDEQISCFSQPERFFSYRASGGACGRHGALAIMEA